MLVNYYADLNDPPVAVATRGEDERFPDVAVGVITIGNGSPTAPVNIPLLAKRTVITVTYTGNEFDVGNPLDTCMYVLLPEGAKAGYIFEFILGGVFSTPGPIVPLRVVNGGVMCCNILEHRTSVLRVEKLDDRQIVVAYPPPIEWGSTLWIGSQSMPTSYGDDHTT